MESGPFFPGRAGTITSFIFYEALNSNRLNRRPQIRLQAVAVLYQSETYYS